MMKGINIVLFIFIGLFSFINLFYKDKRIYSINKFLWLYILIFWSIIPLFQYIVNIFPWDIEITHISALKANILTLLWISLYYFIYYNFSLKKHRETIYEIPVRDFSISFSGILILILIQVLIFIFFVNLSGGLIFLRGEASNIVISETKSIRLLIDRTFRSFTTFASIVLFLNYKYNKSFIYKFTLVISITLLLLTNFPLALARYMAGAFYIGLLFIYKPYFRIKSILYIGFLVLFLMIYPALSYIRYIVAFSSLDVTLWNPASFLTGDYDNFTLLNMTIHYVENNGLTFGRQLMGVFLFFIPRSIWPGKPIGSGHLVADSYGLSFTNLSCPFVAEGYINFGIIGIIFFAFILGYAVAKLDSRFYSLSKLNFIKIFYPVALGMIFFILRGDLMSSFAYTLSFVFAALLVYLISKSFIKYS